MYSDFLCPYCARFARETLPELKRVYVVTGKALLAFRHRPIEKLHPLALQASIAAHCAGLQGMFWEMHDWLFETQETLSERGLLEGATSGTALEQSKYRLCLSSREADRAVRADMASAAALGVNATPVVFIGRVQPDGRVRVATVLEGAKPIREFIRSIDAALMRLE